MAQTSHYKDSFFKNPGVHVITGRFRLNGTSDPDATVGAGYSVARSTTGKFTITLDQGYKELLSAQGSAMLAAAAADAGDLTVHFDPVAADTLCSSVVCYLSQDGTDTDVDNAWVNFVLFMRHTTVTK